MKAFVNKIIPLSVVDGLGARTAIFLQGCNLSCRYCHNPETQNLCSNCKDCLSVCAPKALSFENGKVVWNGSLCIACDECIKVCKRFASPKVVEMTAEEVMLETEKNMPFIRGISVSGGECTLYPEFLTQLFSLAKEKNLSRFIDSNGLLDFEKYPKLVSLCSGVLLDVKSWNIENYRKITTGQDNSIVKKNIVFLAKEKILEEIRIVCLDGVDAENVIDGIHSLIGNCPAEIKLKLIAFRNMGVRSELSNSPNTTMERLETLRLYAKKYFITIECR